ncbi:MAG: ornithine cyclodeaminase family protein [Polyangiales bacterium]
MQTLILTQSQLQQVLPMSAAINAVSQAFAAHGRDESIMPPKVYLSLPSDMGDFRAMPAYLDGSAGVKWVNSHPNNPRTQGLPTVMGVFILSHPLTALPLAVMDATWLTAVRTGAAAAVASQALATTRPGSLGILGCGVQARHLIAAHRTLYPHIEVYVADIARQAAEELAGEVGARAVNLQEAAAADVVCTATPSRSPILRRAWLKPGVHINAMGADAHGKQELDERILQEAEIYVDDRSQASASGEVNVPLSRGTLTQTQIRGTLGELLVDRVRRAPRPLGSVFDSTGLAIQDLALARVAYTRAQQGKLGTEVDLRS